MTKLSVIMPCYNCESTLEEAFESILEQKPIFPFDVTMVDDGSTDGTYGLMRRLALGHRNVTVLQHTHNRGGGAARNTAAAYATGNLLFCVDGDDILGPGFLENMTRYWRDRRCDGLGMSTSIKFRGKSVQEVVYVDEFEKPGERVRFEYFPDATRCSLMVVFMITRAAFLRVGGYPTEHGFDTQGMAFRFLCHGLKAYTCPDTTYYHRVGLPKSYYKREERAGRLNWNWLQVFDEFLYMFRDRVKIQLLENDLFDRPGKAAPESVLEIVAASKDVLAPDYRQLLRKGPRRVASDFKRERDRFKLYWLGNYHRMRGSHTSALACYARALAAGFNFRLVYYRMLQAELALGGSTLLPAEALDELHLYSNPFPTGKRPFHQRLFHGMLERDGLRGVALGLKSLRDRLLPLQRA